MRKIPTIFERDWEGHRGVVETVVDALQIQDLKRAVATEKLDGMNIRITMRSGELVRLEKRRNPNKAQKKKGITEPWYVDAQESEPGDRYLFEAVKSTDLSQIPDGEWSAEALGEKIQGNPLGVQGHFIFVFSLASERARIAYADVPLNYAELGLWLKQQKSLLIPGAPIEGIVWHLEDGRLFKIKVKDFK